MFDVERSVFFYFCRYRVPLKFYNVPIYGSAEFLRNNFCSFRSFALDCEN